MNLFRRNRTGELTGRMVLLWLVLFFGVVFVVNGFMANAAISTFGGVETPSSYKAGQMFEGELAKAERQDAHHWQVDGKLVRDHAGEAVLDIAARDEKGAPLSGLKAVARLAHPANERLDRVFELARIGAGEFHGQIDAKPGQWELMIDLYRGTDRVFRSRNRVTLK
jgi:nitrogen fixation protein FixH